MEGSDFLLAGVLFLFAAVAAVPLASRLGIGAVLGYLLAGIAIGPWGLGFISDVDEILHFSELGVAGGIIDADGFRLAGGGGRWHWPCDVFDRNGVATDA